MRALLGYGLFLLAVHRWRAADRVLVSRPRRRTAGASVWVRLATELRQHLVLPVSHVRHQAAGFLGALVIIALAVAAWCAVGGHVLFTISTQGIVWNLGGSGTGLDR